MTTITETQIQAIGGKVWTALDGTTRYYLNNWASLIDFDVNRYGSGNIRSATLGGERISNAAAGRLLRSKVWWERGEIRTSGPVTNYIDAIEKAIAAVIPAAASFEATPTTAVPTESELLAEREALLARVAEIDALLPEPEGTEMSTRQAAAALSVSVRTVQRWAATGKVQAAKDSHGRWIITITVTAQ